MNNNYAGAKGGAGVAEQIISRIPRHSLYVEPFAGTAAVFRLMAPPPRACLIERDWPACRRLSALVASRSDVVHGDAFELLPTMRLPGDAFVYADPPYLLSTLRRHRHYYRYRLTDRDHARLLTILRRLQCRVMISGYDSQLYRHRLKDWRCESFWGATRRGGRVREFVWMNFPATADLHDVRFVGDGFRERERIKRKCLRWAARLLALPAAERAAVIAAVDEAAGPRVSRLASTIVVPGD